MAPRVGGGCVCGVSVPTATCTVTGAECALRGCDQADCAANCGSAIAVEAAAERLADAERIGGRLRAIARFISRPVSSAAPKRPSGSTASTSSLVCAGDGDFEIVDGGRAVHGEGRGVAALHQVDQHRRQAALDDVPAHAPEHRLAAVARAARIASTSRANESAARMCGSESSQPAMPAPFS